MSDPDPAQRFHFDYLPCPLGGGIYLLPCPGRQGVDDRGRLWQRDLEQDLDALSQHPIRALVTLLPHGEMHTYRIGALPDAARRRGWQWWHWPVTDMAVADETTWPVMVEAMPQIRAIFEQGGALAVHCAAGLGRTGTVAAQMLVAQGVDADEAIMQVRQVRKGAIETALQEEAVRRQKFPPL